MRRKKWAKMAVALKACEILHKAGTFLNAVEILIYIYCPLYTVQLSYVHQHFHVDSWKENAQ